MTVPVGGLRVVSSATPNRRDVRDALSIWTTARQAGRYLRPASIYSHAGHHDDGTPRIADGRLTAERQTVTYFGRDRRAPDPQPGAADAPCLPGRPAVVLSGLSSHSHLLRRVRYWVEILS